jgi:voltage-gated sodium channel
MKQKMQEALIKGEYNVFDFYHETGCAQRIARSQLFENFTFLVITLNAVWLAIDADYNNAAMIVDADPVFQIAENLFCLYFSSELVIRFFAFARKCNCVKDFWFVFDFILVFTMVLETWVVTLAMTVLAKDGSGMGNSGGASVLRMFRMAKMGRVARMARILRAVPELVVLLKTIGVASRSVFFFLLFWTIIIYIFGLGLRQVTKGTDAGERYFASVPEAMNSLLLQGIVPAQASFIDDLAEDNYLLWPIIIAFLVLVSITVMNMLIGVLVEVVGVVASTEKEKMLVLGVKHDLTMAMEMQGLSITRPFPQDEFVRVLLHPDMLSVLLNIGVDPVSIVETTEFIYADLEKDAESKGVPSPGLRFEDFIEIVLKMRGKNPATVKDVKELTRVMKAMLAKTEETVRKSVRQLAMDMQNMRQPLDDDDERYATERESFFRGEPSEHPSSAERQSRQRKTFRAKTWSDDPESP